MLVLAHADGLRVNLDELGERVLQAARDGDGAAHGHVVVGQLGGCQGRGGVDGGTRLRNGHLLGCFHALLAQGANEFAGKPVGFAACGAVANGDELHVLLAAGGGEFAQRLLPLIARGVRVDGARAQGLARLVDDGVLHAVAQARVQAEGAAVPGGRGEQNIAQVGGEHLGRVLRGGIEQAVADALGQARAQVAAPGGAHGGGEPAEHAVLVVHGVEHLHGDAQRSGHLTLVCRTYVLVVFGSSLGLGAGGPAQATERCGGGCHVHLQAHHAGVLGAVQGQNAVRRNGTNTVREGEIVRELSAVTFVPGNDAGFDDALLAQAGQELLAEHRVGEGAVDQNRAGTLEGLLGRADGQRLVPLCAGLRNLLIGGDVGGGDGVRVGEGHLQQVLDEGVEPGSAGQLRAGHALAAVGGVEGVHVCDRGGVHERGTQLQQGERVDKPLVGARGERLEHAGAALFEGA